MCQQPLAPPPPAHFMGSCTGCAESYTVSGSTGGDLDGVYFLVEGHLPAGGEAAILTAPLCLALLKHEAAILMATLGVALLKHLVKVQGGGVIKMTELSPAAARHCAAYPDGGNGGESR